MESFLSLPPPGCILCSQDALFWEYHLIISTNMSIFLLLEWNMFKWLSKKTSRHLNYIRFIQTREHCVLLYLIHICLLCVSYKCVMVPNIICECCTVVMALSHTSPMDILLKICKICDTYDRILCADIIIIKCLWFITPLIISHVTYRIAASLNTSLPYVTNNTVDWLDISHRHHNKPGCSERKLTHSLWMYDYDITYNRL